MARELNKNKMKNDIVLTLSLIISIPLVRVLMNLSGLGTSDYDAILFFVFTFICIKVTYNLFSKIVSLISKNRIRK